MKRGTLAKINTKSGGRAYSGIKPKTVKLKPEKYSLNSV